MAHDDPPISETDRIETSAEADLTSVTAVWASGDSDIAKERSEAIRSAIAERFDRKKIKS